MIIGGRKNENLYQFAIMATIMAAMLNAYGFPGNFTSVFGQIADTLTAYGIFVMEIGVMLISSGTSVRDIRLMDLHRRYLPLYLYTGLITVSSLAVSRYFGLEFITCFRLWVLMLFCLWTAERYSASRILRIACAAQAAFVVLTLVYTLMSPSRAFSAISGDTAFIGLHTTKNVAASELVFGLLLSLADLRLRLYRKEEISRWFLGFVVLQVMMVIMCRATGALLTLLIAAGFLFLFTGPVGRMRRIPIGVVFAGGSILFLIFALTILPLFKDLLAMIGKDVTLTNRTPLWRRIITVMTENHTFFGFGYGMFWRDPSAVNLIHNGFDRYSFLGTMTTGAHNLLMESWLNTGLVGAGALLGTIMFCLRRVYKLEKDAYIFCSVIVFTLMFFGFTERVLTNANSYQVLFLFLALAVGCRRREG